jgi:16S rRNA (guanine966-N2)-methyltransferase
VQRVVAGSLGGRRLLALPERARDVRPSSSRVRSAIFDRLQREVRGARVLDLFAGSGALAIEALSRGAAHATLVELDPALVRFLRRQVEALGLADRVEIHAGDARAWLRRGVRGPFDLVLVDPPWAERELYGEVAAALAAGGALAPGAIVVAEHARERGPGDAPHWPGGWSHDAQRRHGDAVLEFFRAPSDPLEAELP